MKYIKWIALFLSSLLLSIFITGCGGGTDPEADLPTESVKGLVGSSSYIINTAITYDEVSPISGVIFKATTVDSNTSTDIIDAVAGMAMEKNARALASAVNGYVTLGELHSAISLISTQSYIDGNISTINEQIFTKYTEFTVGDYSFSTDTNVTTVFLAKEIANTLAGTDENLSDINSTAAAVTASSFRMFVTVTSFNSEYYYTVSISPDDNVTFNENFALMTALSSGTNYTGINERLVSNRNNFSGVPGASNKADFLFMIDDSGSMGDQQDALTAAANDFDAAITLAGMDYNIAILTTSDGAQDGSGCTENCYDRVVQNVGIIDNNITLFKEQVDDINTSGSPQETGIFNSEQALKSGGLLNTTPFSFPRSNTQLSIVILSDEPSQYSSRAGTSFDPSSNLFVNGNILVNAIVDIGLCATPATGADDPNGQYDDLAIATGGLVGNICNGEPNPNFSAVMQNIVFQASGVYKLEHNFIKPNSIKVTVDGNFSVPSIKDGYMYIEGTNSIAFFGTLPAAGASIEVYYEYPKDINLFSND